jgi:hypothetical protein
MRRTRLVAVSYSKSGSGSVSEPLVTDRSEGEFGDRISCPRADRQMSIPEHSGGLGQEIQPPKCTNGFDPTIQTEPLLEIGD